MSVRSAASPAVVSLAGPGKVSQTCRVRELFPNLSCALALKTDSGPSAANRQLSRTRHFPHRRQPELLRHSPLSNGSVHRLLSPFPPPACHFDISHLDMWLRTTRTRTELRGHEEPIEYHRQNLTRPSGNHLCPSIKRREFDRQLHRLGRVGWRR